MSGTKIEFDRIDLEKTDLIKPARIEYLKSFPNLPREYRNF
jgi:hypothetical protein